MKCDFFVLSHLIFLAIPFSIFLVDIFCHAWCIFALLAITH